MKCNLCNYEGDFLPMGTRKNARCPQCKSLERHRLFVEIFDGKGTALHISPNPGLRQYFENWIFVNNSAEAKEYNISILEDHGWDIEKDAFVGKFDNIILIHVLEHIEDDSKALRNIYDSLNDYGVMWLQVPFEKVLREDAGHKTKFTERGLKAKLTRAGFEHEEIKGFYKCTKVSG